MEYSGLRVAGRERLELSGEAGRVLMLRLRTTLILLALELAFPILAGLWVGSQTSHTTDVCRLHPESLIIKQVSLGADGVATFQLASCGGYQFTITQIAAYGSSIEGLRTINVTSGNFIPSSGTLILTVYFSDVAWQPGARYDFILIDAQRFNYPVTVTA